MIEKIRLKNIQKHTDTTLEFSPHINAIYGETEAGKTSIIRALRKVLFNDGNPNNLVQYGAKKGEITLNVDGHTIERVIGSDNSYTIDGNTLKSFRQGVPKRVADLLNVDPTLSLQKRRDPPFMVYYGAGDIAERFSQMLDVTEIQSTVDRANKLIRDAKEELQDKEAEIKKVSTELEQYNNVDEATELLNNLVAEAEKLQEKQKSIPVIESKYNKYINAERTVTNNAKIKEALTVFNSLIDKRKELETKKINYSNTAIKYKKFCSSYIKVNSLKNAKNALNELNNIEQLTNQYKEVVNKSNQIINKVKTVQIKKQRCKQLKEANNLLTCFNELVEQNNKLQVKKDKLTRINKKVKQYHLIKEGFEVASTALKQAQEQWKSLDGMICPTCGGILHHD